MRYPDIIKEAEAQQRKALYRMLFRLVKITVAAIISIAWDLQYSIYMESHYFLEDIQELLVRYFNQGFADAVAEVIYCVMPWFCVYCLFYPVICYVGSVGIKVNLFW